MPPCSHDPSPLSFHISQSSVIEATLWGELADSMYNALEVNKVYYWTKGQVKPANKQYSSVKNDYTINFGNGYVFCVAMSVCVKQYLWGGGVKRVCSRGMIICVCVCVFCWHVHLRTFLYIHIYTHSSTHTSSTHTHVYTHSPLLIYTQSSSYTHTALKLKSVVNKILVIYRSNWTMCHLINFPSTWGKRCVLGWVCWGGCVGWGMGDSMYATHTHTLSYTLVYTYSQAPVDLLGVVVNVGQLGEIQRKSDGSSLSRRDITIVDARCEMCMCVCSLCGVYACMYTVYACVCNVSVVCVWLCVVHRVCLVFTRSTTPYNDLYLVTTTTLPTQHQHMFTHTCKHPENTHKTHSKKSVQVTLWGVLASDKAAQLETMPDAIVSLSNCRVGDYNGVCVCMGSVYGVGMPQCVHTQHVCLHQHARLLCAYKYALTYIVSTTPHPSSKRFVCLHSLTHRHDHQPRQPSRPAIA